MNHLASMNYVVRLLGAHMLLLTFQKELETQRSNQSCYQWFSKLKFRLIAKMCPNVVKPDLESD